MQITDEERGQEKEELEWRKPLSLAEDVKNQIMNWQMLKMLCFDSQEEIYKDAAYFLIDTDENIGYPVHVGERFPGVKSRTSAMHSFDELIQIAKKGFIYEGDADKYNQFMDYDDMRKRYAAGECFNGIEYRGKRGDVYKWMFATYMLTENEENGHLLAYLLIFDNDVYRRRQEAMLTMAQHDQLTGLFNRYMMESTIQEFLADEDSREGIPISFDLNLFKQVNDTYGHQAGDEMLVAMADRLEEVFFHRRQDFIFRQGGDEFFVLMEDTSEGDAVECLKNITGTPIVAKVGDGQTVYCTISAGYTIFDGSNRNYQQLLNAADRALYHAKDHGRDGWFCKE